MKLDVDKLKMKARLPAMVKNRMAGGAAPKRGRGVRFVIFIGDEGAILVYIKDSAVQSRQFIPDASPANLEEFTQTLARDPKAPVMLVIDSMDQSYVQQTLPPVSSFSVGKLIKRRLDRDFAADDIKGALLLGREKTGRKDWNFLMISVERSPQIKLWLDFIAELPNRFQGIYLVSVEVELLVKQLERAMGAGNEKGGSEWKFFVSHNKVGGYRQVVLHNGRILFTRLAQPLGESRPEVIAGNIEQEIISTIEYMKRLSFDARSGLDIYIIASAGIKPLIDNARLSATSLHVLTPFEVGEYLGIEGATQPSDQFGDVILASAIGCSRKHVLTLSTPATRKIDEMYRLLLLQRAGAALAGAGIIGYIGMNGYDIGASYAKVRELAAKKTEEQKRLDALQTEVSHSSLDITKMDDMIDLYQQLMGEKISPLPFFARLGAVIHAPVRLNTIEWTLGDKDKSAPQGNAGTPRMTAELTLDFAQAGASAEPLKAAAQKTLDEIKTVFKGYKAVYTSQPVGTADNEKLELNFGDAAPAAPNPPPDSRDAKAIEAKLTISGDVIADTSPPMP